MLNPREWVLSVLYRDGGEPAESEVITTRNPKTDYSPQQHRATKKNLFEIPCTVLPKAPA